MPCSLQGAVSVRLVVKRLQEVRARARKSKASTSTSEEEEEEDITEDSEDEQEVGLIPSDLSCDINQLVEAVSYYPARVCASGVKRLLLSVRLSVCPSVILKYLSKWSVRSVYELRKRQKQSKWLNPIVCVPGRSQSGCFCRDFQWLSFKWLYLHALRLGIESDTQHPHHHPKLTISRAL